MSKWLIILARYLVTLLTTALLIWSLLVPFLDAFYPDLDGQSRKYSLITVLVFLAGLGVLNVFLFFSPFKSSPKTEAVTLSVFYALWSVFIAFFIPDYSTILLGLLASTTALWVFTYAQVLWKRKTS